MCGALQKHSFKAFTSLLRPPKANDQCLREVTSKKGISVTKAIRHIDQMLSSPYDKKLKRTTIYEALQLGSFGVSPLKMGRPRIVSPKLTHGLACHAVMTQSSSEGEASALKMRVVAGALTLGTPHENSAPLICGHALGRSI